MAQQLHKRNVIEVITFLKIQIKLIVTKLNKDKQTDIQAVSLFFYKEVF